MDSFSEPKGGKHLKQFPKRKKKKATTTCRERAGEDEAGSGRVSYVLPFVPAKGFVAGESCFLRPLVVFRAGSESNCERFRGLAVHDEGARLGREANRLEGCDDVAIQRVICDAKEAMREAHEEHEGMFELGKSRCHVTVSAILLVEKDDGDPTKGRSPPGCQTARFKHASSGSRGLERGPLLRETS